MSQILKSFLTYAKRYDVRIKVSPNLEKGNNIAANLDKDYIDIIPAGLTYNQNNWKQVYELMQKTKDLKTRVHLVKDPFNEHDINACKVIVDIVVKKSTQRYHIGFIPKKINTDINRCEEFLESVVLLNVSKDVYGKYYGGVIRLQYTDTPKKYSRFQKIINNCDDKTTRVQDKQG